MPVRGDITRFVKKITGTLEKSATAAEFRKLAEEAIKMIQTRTRLGYGVRMSGTKRYKLKPLSAGYVEFRKENRKALHKFARVKKSNLSFTGQMHDSMKVNRLKSNSVIIGPSGRRKDGKSNRKIAQWVSEKGRPFLHLSDLEIKKLRRFYELNISKKIKRARI